LSRGTTQSEIPTRCKKCRTLVRRKDPQKPEGKGKEGECKRKEMVMAVISLFSDKDKFWPGRESEGLRL
jgi:hypothetical protein